MSHHMSWVHTVLSIIFYIVLGWVTLLLVCLVVSVLWPNIIRRPVLFSKVDGIVLDNGKPLANVRVDRVLNEDREDIVDTQHTDQHGRFAFKPIYRQRFELFDFVPHETVISQKILLKYDGKEYEGYFCVKRNLDKNGELGGKPISLIGDLNNEYISVHGDNGGGFKGIFRLRQD